VVLERRRVQRRLALVVGGVDVGAGRHQRQRDLAVPAERRREQRRPAVRVPRVDVRAGGDELERDADAPGRARRPQSRAPGEPLAVFEVQRVRVGKRQRRSHRFPRALLERRTFLAARVSLAAATLGGGGGDERRGPVAVARARVRAEAQQPRRRARSQVIARRPQRRAPLAVLLLQRGAGFDDELDDVLVSARRRRVQRVFAGDVGEVDGVAAAQLQRAPSEARVAFATRDVQKRAAALVRLVHVAHGFPERCAVARRC
jgi:hypothetical protein